MADPTALDTALLPAEDVRPLLGKKKATDIVKLSPEREGEVVSFLQDLLTRARSSRSQYVTDGGYIDTWHALYEQQVRDESERPFEGAADLTTYIVTEKVDALAARLVQVIFHADPVCAAESWGRLEPNRQARVEAFHQWQADEEKVKLWVAKAVKMSLIEGTGVLAVDERPVLQKIKRTARVLLQQDEHGAPLLDEQLNPQPEMDADGRYVEDTGAPEHQNLPKADAIITEEKPVGSGPQYRIISLKDFFILPSHAKDVQDVFGFVERFWVRAQDLKAMVRAGEYDAKAVEKISPESSERETTSAELRQHITAETDNGDTAEKELYRFHLNYDIDGDGKPEWCICTFSERHGVLLRAKFDTLNQSRYVLFQPMPNPESAYGFSFVGHKLWTVADEHTAVRNMIADRSALATNMPIKRLSTSLWDPDDEPFGIGSVMTVRDMNDVQPFVVNDVPQSAQFMLSHVEGAAERLSGTNDASGVGVLSDERRTATEVQTAAQASYVRVSESMDYLRESIAQLWDLRHELWKRALRDRLNGIEAPSWVMRDLETRGVEVPTDGPLAFTSADLEGRWRFIPKGSVETADEGAQRRDFAEFLSQALPAMMKVFPPLQALGQNPATAKPFMERALKLYRVPDAANLVKAMFSPPPQAAPPAGPAGPSATPPGMPPELTAMLGRTGPAPQPAPPLPMPTNAAPVLPGQPQ